MDLNAISADLEGLEESFRMSFLWRSQSPALGTSTLMERLVKVSKWVFI